MYYKGLYSKISCNELASTERILKRKGKVKNKCPLDNLDLSHPFSSTNVSGQASVLKKTQHECKQNAREHQHIHKKIG